MDKLTEKIAQELTVDMIPDGIWKAVAQEIGPLNLIKLFAYINGDYIYIPKPERFLVPAREKLIRQEFNGYNHKALAKKYNRSTAYIRRLCGKEQIAEQTCIFDELEMRKPPK